MPFLKDLLFLISSWKTGMSRAAHSSQDWDHEKGHLLGFSSVTPFSDSFHWPYLNAISSVMPLLLRIWNPFWPFEDCYLLGFVFAQFFFYYQKLPCMKIYKHAFLQIKHPCFTWDLGPLCPSTHQLQSPGPGLQRPWCHTALYSLAFSSKSQDAENYLTIFLIPPKMYITNSSLHA